MRDSPTPNFTTRLLTHQSWVGLGGALLLALITVIVTLYINDLLLPYHWYYLTDDDQARSALVARSLAMGMGYKTPLLPNAMIDFYHQMGKLNVDGLWENSDRFPMTIFGIYLLFKLFGSTSFFLGIAVFGSLFFIASAALLYQLTRFITGKPVAALLAVAFMCVTHDMSDTIFFKGADDIFYALLVLYTYAIWREKIYAAFSWRPVMVGIFLGLAFLCRANMGVFFIVGIAADALWSLYRGELRFAAVCRAGALTFLGFAACILPFGIYTYRTWGIPFFSANSLYQFSFYTPYQMATDSWWKLHTPVGKISNIALFKSDPMPFLRNWFHFISYNVVGLPTAYFLFVCAGAYGLVMRWNEGTFGRVRPFLIVAFCSFFLNLISLGFFIDAGYAPAYLIYIIPVFFVLAADGLGYLSHLEPLVKRVQISRQRMTYCLAIGIGVLCLAALIRASFPFIASHLGISGTGLGVLVTHVIFRAAVLVALLLFGLRMFHHRREKIVSYSLLLWAVISFGVVTLLTPNVDLRRDAYISLPMQTPSLEKLEQVTNPNGIVLSFNGFYGLPWLIDRKALGLPEYPDYIYEMIAKYNLPIDSIYLDGPASWFYFSSAYSHWSPSYVIYPILAAAHGVIPGFELVDYRYETQDYPEFNLPSIAKDIAVYRRIPGFDFKQLMEPPTSYTADNPNDRIHFVSGFGEVGSFDGNPVIFASNEVHNRFLDRPARLHPGADSDITFRATADRKPKAIVIDAYMLGKTQLYFYLNLDLDIYDRPRDRGAKQVADMFIADKGWRQIRIPLPQDRLNDGLNKIGFHASVFNTLPVCNWVVDARIRIPADKLHADECFKFDGSALTTGILSDPDRRGVNAALPSGAQSDPGEMQKTVTEAAGTMLIRKVTFEY